jgi:hypothetical protein
MTFAPGHKSGGRPLGVKNKLSRAFVEALAKDFEEFGERAIRQARVTKPEKYLQIIANLVPREFLFHHNTVAELTDEELDKMIYALRDRVREERIAVETPLMLTVEKVKENVG